MEILIHVGVDTVDMNGDGFSNLVKLNQVVKKGDLLMTMDLDKIQAAGHPTTVILALTNSDDFSSVYEAAADAVRPGDDLLRVSKQHGNMITNAGENIFMRQFQYTITDPVGIHARPAGLLVKAAKTLDSTVVVQKEDGKSTSATKLIALMRLNIKHGDTVTVTVEGGNEDANFQVIEQFFQENL